MSSVIYYLSMLLMLNIVLIWTVLCKDVSSGI